jgi:hypothetical protein
MSEPLDSLDSASDSGASSATLGSGHDDSDNHWVIDPPEIEPQDDYEAIVDCPTEWAYRMAFAFVKERSGKTDTAPHTRPSCVIRHAGAAEYAHTGLME